MSGEGGLHVQPIGDFREHMPSRDCWCKPVENEPNIWRHNSMDQRELYERGERKIS